MRKNMNKKIFDAYEYLKNGDVKSSEIKDMLDIKNPTFQKYMSLFKKAGFKTSRINEIRKIIFYSNAVKLSDAEIGLVAYLLYLSYTIFPKTKIKIFQKLIDKMLKLTDKKTEEEIFEKFNLMKKINQSNLYQEKIELFERYRNDDLNITVTLKTGEKTTLKPIEVVFKNRRIYFNFLDSKNNAKKLININKVVKLTPKPNEIENFFKTDEVVFELYGRLSKVYLLKEGERIIYSANDKIVVSNSTSDKDALFRRLLKYDTLCKVKYPKKDVADFTKIVKKSLENILTIKDNINNEVLN